MFCERHIPGFKCYFDELQAPSLRALIAHCGVYSLPAVCSVSSKTIPSSFVPDSIEKTSHVRLCGCCGQTYFLSGLLLTYPPEHKCHFQKLSRPTGSYLLVCYRGGPDSIPCQLVWGAQWTKWHRPPTPQITIHKNVVLVQAIQVHSGGGGMTPFILHHGTRWRSVVSFKPRPLYPRGREPMVPLE